MQRDLRRMFGNQLILNSTPPISKFIVCLLMTPMLSIFTLVIEFDCLFLAIFQSFRVFLSFIFDKLASPPIYASKDALNHYLNPFQNIKQSQNR